MTHWDIMTVVDIFWGLLILFLAWRIYVREMKR